MIWAAVDVMGGNCVQLIQGDPKSARFSQDPIAAAERWIAEGADGVHLVDLDAALGKGNNLLIQRGIGFGGNFLSVPIGDLVDQPPQ